MTKKYGPCTKQALIDWLNKHLDDCPTEWQLDDDYGMDYRTAIAFETAEEYNEPSDQEMMANFGTKWHDGL